MSDKRVLRNHVGGVSVDSVDGQTTDLINPTTGDVRGKSSYVLPLDDQMLIGCGAYRSALTDENNRIL